MTMQMITTAVWRVAVCSLGLFVVLAGEDDRAVRADQPSMLVPLDNQAWSMLYSPGMPPHPMPRLGGGWYFDFPHAPDSVNYVLAEVSTAAIRSVDAVETSIVVTTTGAPTFGYDFGRYNSCQFPAHVRLLLQQKGDDLSGTNGKQYFRWWSNRAAYQLAPGSAHLRAVLTDLSQWTSVFGEKANASAAATDGFKQAIANLGHVGFSFGGGCFYGHGVHLTSGDARFTVIGFTLK
jgi:hypothetical protein